MARTLPLLLLAACLVPDPVVDAYLDRDDDGWWTTDHPDGEDCDDSRPQVAPGMPELCDGLDNDCDGETDEDSVIPFWRDRDGDGHGDAADEVLACAAPEGYADTNRDCNDADPAIHPEATERCANGIDDNCNERVDESGTDPVERWIDADRDGVGGSQRGSTCNLEGYASESGDCDDNDPDRWPGAEDAPYDGVDADCDGSDDYDHDGDGYPVDPEHVIDHPGYPAGTLVDCRDNDASVFPGAVEVLYDNVDDNCDPTDDHDGDGDGYGIPEDCDDLDASVFPGATDLPYDGIDADCDPSNEWDLDGDGVEFGDDCNDADVDNWNRCADCADHDGDGAFAGCDAYTLHPWDCNDADPDIGPHALDLWGDDADSDCDGAIDDALATGGIFVTADGVDAPGCGTPASPCRQPAYAMAADPGSDGPLFLGGGDFERFDAAMPVFGGFNGQWQRDGTRATRVLAEDALGATESAVAASGDEVYLDGLTFVGDGSLSVSTVMDLRADRVLLRDVAVSALGGTDTCIGARLEASWVDIDGIEVRGCASGRQSTGIKILGEGAQLTHLDVDIRTLGAGDLTTALDLSLHAVDLTESVLSASGGNSVYGVRFASPGAIQARVEHATVEADGLGASRHVWGLAMASAHDLQLLRSRIRVRDGVGAVGINHNGNTAGIATVDTSEIAVASGPGIGLYLRSHTETHYTLRHSTVAAAEGDLAFRLGADPLLELDHVAIGGFSVLVTAEGRFRMDSVRTDATCVQEPQCDPAALATCSFAGCLSSDNSAVAGDVLVFDAASGLWLPGTASEDAGTSSYVGTDLQGAPRPQGAAWDIGAVELTP